ncbi:restriction endonuclease [Herbaspirillum sp. LeCh32-8]|uniref:restriction endonuclease n=1 Tax=Herbaspirillum sp. LeCh32-8 TaxID=2821356 RepID=UPI001AE2C68F|nr:restriction endonuclease [Herbaspirillum sp. LeCh32-8]MBP0597946.1 restriction endonuclease [Herbaspirillum sp. LeCh32-8]
MSEPTTGAYAVAVGTVTITGSFLGLQYDLLLVGLAGGLVVQSLMRQVSVVRMLVSIITSALAAGYIGPVLAAAIPEYVAWAAKIPDQIRWCSAFVCGIGAQTVVQLALRQLCTRFGGGEPGPEASQ